MSAHTNNARRGKFQDMTGQRFDKLVVLRPAPGREGSAKTYWFCQCDCGKEIIRRSDLLKKTKKKQSCGCSSKGPVARPIEERFWEQVDKKGLDECWLWTGNRVPKKSGPTYGYFTVPRTMGHGKVLAHRYSYLLAYGPFPDHLCVLHRCDVTACVNPNHLFLGTRTDNAADREAKGRTTRGENHRKSILTEAQARWAWDQFKTRAMSITKIAVTLGVSHACIGGITAGKAWRSVTGLPKPKFKARKKKQCATRTCYPSESSALRLLMEQQQASA